MVVKPIGGTERGGSDHDHHVVMAYLVLAKRPGAPKGPPPSRYILQRHFCVATLLHLIKFRSIVSNISSKVKCKWTRFVSPRRLLLNSMQPSLDLLQAGLHYLWRVRRAGYWSSWHRHGSQRCRGRDYLRLNCTYFTANMPLKMKSVLH